MVGEYLGATAAPNTPFALRENFVEKPQSAWKRWKNAGPHYQTRAARGEMANERTDNLYEAFQCDIDPNTNAPHCRALIDAKRDLAPVSKNLGNVKNPNGFKEKAKNAFLRGNRRDKQTLSETTELINEAEALQRSRMMRAGAAPPQAPPSYNAAVNTWGPSYEPKQDRSYSAPYQPGPNFTRDLSVPSFSQGGDASFIMYEESITIYGEEDGEEDDEDYY